MEAYASGFATFIPVPFIGESSSVHNETSTKERTPLLQELESKYPELDPRILKLFKRYGSDARSRSGFSLYESIAEQILFIFPKIQLATTLIGIHSHHYNKRVQAIIFAHLTGAIRHALMIDGD